MIRLHKVVKKFNSGKSTQFTAVDEVSLAIRPGQVTILKGPSGSGKTTLLSLIGCMARPSSGRITLHGVAQPFLPAGESSFDISSLPERFLTEIRRTTFGFIFQQFNLIKGITVLENVMLPAYPLGETPRAVAQRAQALLDHFGLSRHAASPVEWLSGGEQQRVAIARALINNPTAIVADEPTAHLDSALSSEFMATVGAMKAEGKTILIASHDPIVYDSTLADTVVAMRDGRVTGIEHAV